MGARIGNGFLRCLPRQNRCPHSSRLAAMRGALHGGEGLLLFFPVDLRANEYRNPRLGSDRSSSIACPATAHPSFIHPLHNRPPAIVMRLNGAGLVVLGATASPSAVAG